MRVTPIDIPGVLMLEPSLLSDHRGCFTETYHAQRYRDAGITEHFIQDNCSRSVRNTLRGLHFQEPHAQGKLVMAVEGTVYDVVVDIRKGSPTFGKWHGVELSGTNLHQMYIPPGCAHGFCVTSETATFFTSVPPIILHQMSAAFYGTIRHWGFSGRSASRFSHPKIKPTVPSKKWIWRQVAVL